MAGEPPIDQEDDTPGTYLDQILRRLNSDQEASASPSSTSGDMASSIPHPSLNPMTSSTIPWQHTSPSDTSSSHGNPGSQNSQQLYRPPIPSNYRDPLAEFPWLMDELDQQRGTQIPVTTSRTAPTRPSIHSGQSYTSRYVDVPYNHERRLEQLEGGSGSSGRELLTSEGGMGRTILHRPNPSRRGGVQGESNQGEGTSSRAPPLRRQLSQSVQRDRPLERSYNTSHVGPPVRTRSVPLSQRNPGAIGESHEVAQMRWPQSESTGQTYLESTQTELHSAIPSSGAGSRAPPSPLLLPGGSMNSETPNSGSISSEPMSDGDDEEEKKDSGASKQEVRKTGGEGASSGKRKTPEPSTEDGDESAKSESEALKKPAMNRPRKRGGAKRLREPRYAIKTRTEVDIMDDGFKWRKYGQKAVKNSPHPSGRDGRLLPHLNTRKNMNVTVRFLSRRTCSRPNYYRCTTPQCPVRKRVERSCEDSGLVITTYEGTHTHQTPGFHRSSPGGYFGERGLHGGLYLPGQNPLGTFGIGSSNLLQYPGRFNLASLQQAALRGQLGSRVNSNLGILGQSDQAALRLQEADLQHQQESLLRAQQFLGLQESFHTGQVKREPFQYGGQEFLPRGAPPFNPRQFQRPSGSSQGGEGSHVRELLDRGLMRDGSQGPFSGLDYSNLPQQMTNEMTHLRSSLGRGRGYQEQVGPGRGSQEPFTGVPRVRHQDLARAMMYSSEGSERRVEEGTLHPRRGVVPAAVEDLQGGSSGSEMDITDAAGLLQDIVRPGGPVLSRPL